MGGGIFRLLPKGDPVSGMEPSNLTGPDSFTGADRGETIHEFFGVADGSVSVGVWLCAPSREEIESYPVHEMMTVLEGAVTLTDADGKAHSFTAGDSFFVAKGTKCTWHITETLRKFYMSAA